jgi:hypothetical protein
MKLPLRAHARMILLAAAALLLAAWLLPPFFHAGRYRRVLKAGLESKLGRPVELGAVSVRLLPHPGFSIGNVLIEEDPRFGSEPFARVDRVECDLRWRSLLGSRLDCARILLEGADLNVVRNNQGRWNIEDFFLRSHTVSGIRSPRSKTTPGDGFELDVEGTHLNFISGITKTVWTVAALSGGLTLSPSAGSIRFHFTGSPVRTGLTLPATPGTIELSGEWKPGENLHGPFTARVDTDGSLLYGWIPFLTGRNPEIYGLASAAIKVAGTVDRLRFHGEAQLDQLHRWESLPPLSSMPVALNFSGSYTRSGGRLFVQSADAEFAGSHLHLAGTIDQFPGTPRMDVVLAIERSQLSDVVSMISRLSGRATAASLSGRVDGSLTVQGPWRRERCGGLVGVRSFRLRERAISFQAPALSVQIGETGARLLAARFLVGPNIEGIVKGSLFPALPGFLHKTAAGRESGAREVKVLPGRPASKRRRTPAPLPGSNYELTLVTPHASLHALTRLARSLGVRPLRDLNAEGNAEATVKLAGSAWPFSMPRFTAEADLDQAQLFVPGLTEPVHFRHCHLEARDRNIRIDRFAAQVGSATLTGWVSHQESRAEDPPWEFGIRTPRLSVERASLWFAALGHRSALPILDLIPGLSSLVAGRRAGRNIFASLRAQGDFESPLVTFRSIGLRNVRAAISIAGRVAKIDDASFEVADGRGNASGRIDFKRAPAQVSGNFSLQGGKLGYFAPDFPPALRQVSGAIFATGQFTTRGLTRQEMSANLQGETRLIFQNISFGRFDPLQAVARAAFPGRLRPEREAAHLSSARLNLIVAHERIYLQPFRVIFSGARLDLKGNLAFNGAANLLIHADLNAVPGRLRSGGRTPLIADNPSQAESLPEDPFADVPSSTTGSSHAPFPSPAGVPSFSARLDRRGWVALLRLGGPLKNLAVVRGVERAKVNAN